MTKIIGTNLLMKHLRDFHNIDIKGSNHKRKLRNYGYFHGFKGYRYIKNPVNKINYNDFDEIIAFNDFDLELKSMFYPQIMFIETALKNYVLEEVLIASQSNNFEDIFKQQLTYYKSFTISSNRYKKQLQKRLRLRNQFYSTISRDYSNDKKLIQHFYHTDKILPIWAIFEVISMGDFGTFVSCLDTQIKKKISVSIDLNQSCDSDSKLTERIIFALKELRNSIAHNDVVFDTRFKTSKIAKSLSTCIELDTGINNINFQSILDYLILVIYLLKKLHITKNELKKIVTQFDTSISKFRSNIPYNFYSRIFQSDTRNKLNQLKKFI